MKTIKQFPFALFFLLTVYRAGAYQIGFENCSGTATYPAWSGGGTVMWTDDYGNPQTVNLPAGQDNGPDGSVNWYVDVFCTNGPTVSIMWNPPGYGDTTVLIPKDPTKANLYTVIPACYNVDGTPPPPPPPKANNTNDVPYCDTNSCGCGMPVWRVSEPYISLWLNDEPLGYQPAIGSRVSFTLSYKQRESGAGFNPNVFSVGKRWYCSWLSYVTQDSSGNKTVYLPDGGVQVFNTTSNYLTNTKLTGNTSTGFMFQHPDGSEEVYGFLVTNTDGTFESAFMSQQVNAQGQTILFNYVPYTPGPTPVIQLSSVVDGDGRTNHVFYNSTSTFSQNLISAVVDPFNRTNSLTYDNNGELTNSVDVAGLSSSFVYDQNGWVTNLITPYGTNSFAINDGTNSAYPNGRSILVTRPDGSHELYLYKDYAIGAESSDTPPATSPFANTFNTTHLDSRNSYYWGPRQYAALSTTTISSFTAADFLKARMRHWLLDSTGNVGSTVSIERDPSPDSGGTIEGQKTWYDYAGKIHTEYEGIQYDPQLVARTLPDGSTSFVKTDRNSIGNAITEISTYSGGLRTNLFVYSSDGIDLIIQTNALGVIVSSNAYNNNHAIVSHYNALGELTSYTYNGNQQVTSATLPTGLVITNIYGPDNFPAQLIAVGFATNSYTYANDLIFTHTDERGLATTNLWDNLNRLTSVTFPDGSYISNVYTRLDLTAFKDRMGYWTYFDYDSLRRKIAETNANQAVTHYDYCTCGALESIVDAAGNTTIFNYDNQGNLTNTVYADGYSVTNAYDLMGRLIVTSNNNGNGATNAYNNQGLIASVKNAAGLVASYAYDALDRVTNSVDANGVSVNTTYDNLDRPLTRSYPDNGVEKWGYTFGYASATAYTNQIGNVTFYGYDVLNRKLSEAFIGVTTNQFGYNGAGDLLTLTDGKSQVTTWYYDTFGRVTNKVDMAGRTDFVYQYDTDNRLTNRWTPAMGNTAYTYDGVGNRKSVLYPQSSILYSYDALNLLTNMVDSLGTNAYVYDAAGQLLSAGGLWSNDTVSYTYTNRECATLSVGAWSQGFAYDAARRLTGLASPAGAFGYSYDSTRLQRVNRILLPNTAYITNTYDLVARLAGTYLTRGTDNHVLDGYSYLYDPQGERTNVLRNYGLSSGSASAGYDAIGELTSWSAKEANGAARLNEQLCYGYDAAGNLNVRTNNALVQNFSVNNVNELTGIGRSGVLTVSGNTPMPASSVSVNGQPALTYADFSFASSNGFALNDGQNVFTNLAKNYYGTLAVTNIFNVNLPQNVVMKYDANGNLTNDGVRSFGYDPENQLTNVTVAGQWREDFLYDGLNRRRIARQYTWVSGTWVIVGSETHYIYEGNVVIQEWDVNNNPQVTYTRGLDLSSTQQRAGGIGGLLARTDTNGVAYYHADGNGNVTSMMDTNQYVVARYLYDPFGKTLGKWGTLADANTYRFSSKEWDSKFGLYYFGHRYYEPSLQRFINRDPIQEIGGKNLYKCFENDPVDLNDPTGLIVKLPCWLRHFMETLLDIPDRGPYLDPTSPDYNYYYDKFVNPNPASLTVDQPEEPSIASLLSLGLLPIAPELFGAEAAEGGTPLILQNAANGQAFENSVINALGAVKNTTSITVDGLGTSIPDVIDASGNITEIKSGINLSYSPQMQIQAQTAQSTGGTFNLMVGPNNQYISGPLQNAVYQSGGTIQVFNPATGTFTSWLPK